MTLLGAGERTCSTLEEIPEKPFFVTEVTGTESEKWGQAKDFECLSGLSHLKSVNLGWARGFTDDDLERF